MNGPTEKSSEFQSDEILTAQNSSRGIELTNERVEQIEPESRGVKFGNIKLLMNGANLHISVGPDYGLFLVGLLFTFGIVSLLNYCTFTYIEGLAYWKVISACLGVWVHTCYLLTALSNPGIYDPREDPQPKTRYCHECQIQINDSVRHCFKCKVCIRKLDHHCPWMSKCVGSGNIKTFYMFIVSLPFTMAFFWVTIFMVFSRTPK